MYFRVLLLTNLDLQGLDREDMTQEIINVGVNADDGSGDSLYEAGNKINNNFTDFFNLTVVQSVSYTHLTLPTSDLV